MQYILTNIWHALCRYVWMFFSLLFRHEISTFKPFSIPQCSLQRLVHELFNVVLKFGNVRITSSAFSWLGLSSD